jgi:lysophospholipase L1-like esterase
LKRGLGLLLLCFLTTAVSAQGVPVSTLDHITRARQGAGYAFPFAYQIPPSSPVTPLYAAPNGEWIQVEFSGQLAWVTRDSLDLPLDFALPLAQNLPPEPATFTDNCISVVGDSVPHGEVVYQVPGQGYAVLRMTPLSVVLQDSLTQYGLSYIEIRDRSASAAFLSEQGKHPYSQTDTYAALLEDRCRWTVVMPWINDMSVEREDNAQAHLEDLTQLLSTLQRRNIAGKILVLGFYYGQPSAFADRHAPGYTEENITLFNETLFTACRSDLSLGSFQNVVCMETAGLFADLEESHVALVEDQESLLSDLYEPIPDGVRPFFDAYWSNDPAAEVYGDGVHLSAVGKLILVEAIIDKLLEIDPNL